MTVIACIPGKQFSGKFLESWSNTLVDLRERGIQVLLRNKYSSNVYHCRTSLLKADGGHAGRRLTTKPFDGLEYNYMLWIDSDMVWAPSDVRALLQADKDIITALAITDAWTSRLNCGLIDDKGQANFYHNKEIGKIQKNEEGLWPIDFCGFGFVVIKHGVFEAMPFPWFRPMVREVAGVHHFPSEDISWCMWAKESGFELFADPAIRVGHEKSAIMKVRSAEHYPVENNA